MVVNDDFHRNLVDTFVIKQKWLTNLKEEE